MLDTITKRRIDNARDILVGKVPDPKSQVEQITIALIYKFMDDMDAEAEELGGKRKFFTGDFARYGWAKLMSAGIGGHELIGLYGEGIATMPQNPGIPALFRDIFKNAYLPYRDPETLKSFLKIIDEFSYDHSERLGDAYEYLLSVLGSQGDAGQFRTPRHIIDFMVEIMAPKKNETITDTSCGTAGFLISAYKHILKHNSKDYKPKQDHEAYDEKGVPLELLTLESPLHYKGDLLTPDERKQLAGNIKGYDISPDMVRMSLVNLYLHGFNDPHIFEYDTLTSEERWDEYSDVIFANPPFMSPKGGIKPHKRFSIQAKRSEVLFVDYIAEHLTPAGRAGIIVPEGIIFQSQTAYKALRKMLVDNSLVAVISLPAGVFQPYSGVKTSILILDKSLAKQSDTIAFFKIENDGFGLGAQRRAIEKNDLPQVKAELDIYLQALRTQQPTDNLEPILGLTVAKEKIAANGDYNLSGERYREGSIVKTDYPLVPLGDLMPTKIPSVDPSKFPDETFELWSIPAFDSGSPEICKGSAIGSQKKCVIPGDVLLSKIVPHIRRSWVVKSNDHDRRQIASGEWITFRCADIAPQFLARFLVSDVFHSQFMQTVTGVGGSLLRANPEAVRSIQIPLPPLEVQKEIVEEIEGYQKVINGARAVLDNYRPHIPIHPDWPMVVLDELCVDFQNGANFSKEQMGRGTRFVNIKDLFSPGYIDWRKLERVDLSDIEVERKKLKRDDLLFVRSSVKEEGVGFPSLMTDSDEAVVFCGFIIKCSPNKEVALPAYLLHLLRTPVFRDKVVGLSNRANITNISQDSLKSLPIPLPPLATQQAIVAEIEAEQALVAANRELIARFEKKIQATLARVWGES